MSENDLRKQQVGGFYSDIDLPQPTTAINDDVTKKERELEGTKKTGKQETVYTLLECHVNLDLEGFEDKDANGDFTESSSLYCDCRRRFEISSFY